MICLILELGEEKRTFMKIKGGKVDFYLLYTVYIRALHILGCWNFVYYILYI